MHGNRNHKNCSMPNNRKLNADGNYCDLCVIVLLRTFQCCTKTFHCCTKTFQCCTNFHLNPGKSAGRQCIFCAVILANMHGVKKCKGEISSTAKSPPAEENQLYLH